jgi:riboflavin kinase/FMN adenylyltransferase
MSFREKFLAIKEQGIDRVLRIRFDAELSQVKAEDFIKDIFHRQLGIRHMVVGDDLRFGHERRGDFNLLTRMGKDLGFSVSDTQTLEIDEDRASSTRIRQVLADADFALAERLLGRPYSISGKVVYGQQLGRTLGIPTANLKLQRIKAALSGVYAVQARINNGAQVYDAVANIGTRPTVDDSIHAILEVHLLHFNAEIYGRNMDVTFIKKLRDEKRFASIALLKEAIHQDIQTAQQLFQTEVE